MSEAAGECPAGGHSQPWARRVPAAAEDLLNACPANSVAAGRFTTVLPHDLLVAHDVPLEPDQLDGRRLAASCLWAAGIVISSIVGLSPLGVPAELVVPVALVALLIAVYTLFAFRFGLSEATRLTRSIGGFFSAGPPA